MNNKLFLALFALLAGSLAFAGGVSAYRGDPNVQGPNYSPERHEAMIKAFQNKDYNAWKQLMQGKGRVTQVISEGNFAKFAQMHQLRLEGKVEEANKIRTELGLGTGLGGQSRGYGRTSR